MFSILVAGCDAKVDSFTLKNDLSLCADAPDVRATRRDSTPSRVMGLDFPGSDATPETIRFKFASPLQPYPATYIWRVWVRSQTSYYTTMFWGNDDGAGNTATFLWDDGNSNTYYGAHPYPYPAPNIVGRDKAGPRRWEISVASLDILSDSTVEYGRWHSQALLAWADEKGRKHHIFYWDLPDTDKAIRHVEGTRYGEKMPPAPALTFGDAPWNPSEEIHNGLLRGIQIYSGKLSVQDVLRESQQALSTKVGSACVWYMNLNPTPEDISDKSGSGNHPHWVGPGRPKLWLEGQLP